MSIQLDHSAVAQKLNDLNGLPIRLERTDVQQHLESLLKRFSEEKTLGRSNWDFMGAVQKLYDMFADQENRLADSKITRPNVIQQSKTISQSQRQTIVNNPNAKSENKTSVLKLYPKSTTKLASAAPNGQSGGVISPVPRQQTAPKSPKKVDIKIGVKVGNDYNQQQVKQQQVIVSAQQPLLPAASQVLPLQTSGVQIQQIQRLPVESQYTRIFSQYSSPQQAVASSTGKASQQAQPILFITKDRGDQQIQLIPIAAPQTAQTIQKYQVSQATKIIQPTNQAPAKSPVAQIPKKPVNKPTIVQQQAPVEIKQPVVKKTGIFVTLDSYTLTLCYTMYTSVTCL